MSYDAERVALDLYTLLQDSLGTALDAVEGLWVGSDPLALPEPVTWHWGHKPDVVDMVSAQFPFVSVMVAATAPVAAGSRWGYQEETVTLYVDYFCAAGDAETVDKLVHRYAEAILSVLQDQATLGGYTQLDWRPAVELSEAMRHAATTDSDIWQTDQTDYLKMGRVTVRVQGG